MAKTGEVDQAWHVIDATGLIVGRLASKVAMILMGKHRPTYTPHVDTGDFVIIVNAEKVRLTGNKMAVQKYDWFTGYPGGYRSLSPAEMLQKHPDKVIREAIRRMLPKTRLAKQMYTKLKVYVGPEHPHQAQQPVELKL
jgi:large subunit ribosomal protein L13